MHLCERVVGEKMVWVGVGAHTYNHIRQKKCICPVVIHFL